MMSEILPIAEQTELDEPIKVSLSTRTRARTRLVRQMEIANSDGQEPWTHAGSRAVGSTRQKTNVVIKTREEVESLYRAWQFAHPRSDNTRRALRRFFHTVTNELKRRGLEVDKSEDYRPRVVEIDGAGGEPPHHAPFEPGDVLNVTSGSLGYTTTTEDGEKIPSPDEKAVTVDRLGAEQVLVQLRRSFSPVDHKLRWIPYDAVESINHEAMERRERRSFIRERREQADKDALLDVVERHCEQVAADVWPAGTVPVDEITFTFNPQFSWLGGRYFRRTDWKHNGPKIELAFDAYVSKGLAYLLSIARHELIHAWQDYHPDGHPEDTHKHHGRDFHQWVDALDTHRYCNY